MEKITICRCVGGDEYMPELKPKNGPATFLFTEQAGKNGKDKK